MIKKYRKKPVTIKAIQLKIDTVDECYKFTNGLGLIDPEDGKFKINTLEGKMIADINDFIIQGVQGEFYPCKPEIFEKTYEEIK